MRVGEGLHALEIGGGFGFAFASEKGGDGMTNRIEGAEIGGGLVRGLALPQPQELGERVEV